MPAQPLSTTTALVTGASRGFGRGVAVALAAAGARVVGVARDGERLQQLRTELGDSFVGVAGDATDPFLAGTMIDRYRPRTVVLAAGATPLPRPIQHHTWQTFSRNWEVDVQQVFHWTREALLTPLAPGSVVIAFSSGAAIGGSPLSGGYSGAKAAVRFLSSYAAEESERLRLGIRFVCVLPQLTPATDLGAVAVAGYAKREGLQIATFLERRGAILTPERVGTLIAELAADAADDGRAYVVTAEGMTPAP